MSSPVMRRIVSASVRLRFLVLALAAIVLLVGLEVFRDMPVDVFPEVSPPFVEIQTEALGLSAAEVESLITVPLEADLLNGVAWLDRMSSESVAGLSSILLVFEPRTDPIQARQMVQERLTQTFALPNVSKPPTMLQPLSSTNRVLMIGLSSTDLSPIELGVLARWNIKPRLLGVPGVANVAIWGQRERQLQVQVDPKRLRARGVTLEQVIETAGNALWVSPLSFLNASTPGTAGWVDTPNQRLGLHHVLPIKGPEDLARVSVVGSNGRLLGDVAAVVEDHQPLIGDAILRDGPGLLLVVEKFPGADTLAVTRDVEEALEALRPGLSGVEIDTTVFRPADYLERAIGNLATALLLGAVLVALVLFAFLDEWRSAVIGAAVIPLSLVVAGLVLYFRGLSINAMTVAGLMIAIGAVVDDAVAGVENIVRRLRQPRRLGSDQSPASVILEAVLEMRSPLAFATLIILVAVLPVFALSGSSGALLGPLVLSYALSVLASLAVALTVTPALGVLLLRTAPLSRRPSPLLRSLAGRYGSMLARVLRAPRLASGTIALVALVGFVALPFLRLSLLPPFRQTDLRIRWEGMPGTSRPEMSRITAQVSQELRSLPGVRNVGSHVGRAVTGDQVVGINSGELWVSLDPAADYDATVAAVREAIDGYPGLVRTVRTDQPESIGEALTGADQDLVVRVYGHDLDVLRGKAEEVQQYLARIEGIADARVALPAEEPQVEIEVDLAAAERHQVKPGDVRRQATTLLSGLQVGSLFEEQKVFDVVVWGMPALRNSLTTIHELPIDTPGGQVRLQEVAKTRIVPAPVIIKRDAVSRFVDVGARVRGRDPGVVAREVKEALARVAFPLEYHAEVLGASAERQAARQRTLGVAAAAAIGAFLLLQAAFGSWRAAALFFVTLPAALVGGVLAVLASGGVLSLGSLFGFLAVLGISVRNGLVLIRHIQHLEAGEGEPFGPALVFRGASERLTPVLMTACAIGLALVPLVVFGNLPGYEILRPMAVVILGGLGTSTLLTLFGLPVLCLRFLLEEPPVDGRSA